MVPASLGGPIGSLGKVEILKMLGFSISQAVLDCKKEGSSVSSSFVLGTGM